MSNQDASDFMPDYLDLLQANRKLGYSTATAIADICDNPVDAGATQVWVELTTDANNKVNGIIISDNGKGMSEYELQKALVPASTGRVRNVQSELGFFGVGLVASGLSLGNKLEVYTRGTDGDLYSYIDWTEKCLTNNPVNLIRKCNLDESTTTLNARIRKNKSGTVIWISDLNIAHSKYDSLVEKLEFHLGVTYYNLRHKYQVFLNNKLVKPWDILESGQGHHTSPVFEYPVKRYINGKHVEATIKLQLSYLKKDNQERPSSIYGTVDANQAGALERNGRILAYGTWIVDRQKSGIYNSVRFKVSYDNTDLDSIIFDINVQKDDCKIVDQEFYDWLNKHIQTYWREIGKPTYYKYRRTTQPTIQKVSGKKMPVKLERILFVADHKLTQSIKNVDVSKVSADQALNMLKTLHSLAISVDKSADEARRWKKENTASNQRN